MINTLETTNNPPTTRRLILRSPTQGYVRDSPTPTDLDEADRSIGVVDPERVENRVERPVPTADLDAISAPELDLKRVASRSQAVVVRVDRRRDGGMNALSRRCVVGSCSRSCPGRTTVCPSSTAFLRWYVRARRMRPQPLPIRWN